MAERDALPSHIDTEAVARGLAEMEQAIAERDRYREALETLMDFGKRLMSAETMEERGIGACICESARVIESA